MKKTKVGRRALPKSELKTEVRFFIEGKMIKVHGSKQKAIEFCKTKMEEYFNEYGR